MTMKDEEWEVLNRGTRDNTNVHGFIGGFQYFKRKDNEGCDERIG